MNTYDLLIIIRCHDYADLVVDTFQSVIHNTSPNTTKVVFAIDGGFPTFAEKMLHFFGRDCVYVSNQRWGWGPGLYSLLSDSYLYFSQIYKVSHIMSIDYDTLFLGPDVDKNILDSITDDKIGLLGCRLVKNAHWADTFEREQSRFVPIFGNPGPKYRRGEGVQGGAMILTNSLLTAMHERKMFGPPYSIAKFHTTIADDHLLPIFVRICGLEIVDTTTFACCHWTATQDPRGLERKGIKIFHPTKLRPRNKSRTTETEVRNYFRKLRGCKDLLK